MAHSERPSNVVKAKEEVIGRTVKNIADETLGKIIELVIDKASGIVGYAVLDAGSFLGIGGKYFALPWGLLHFDDDDNCFRAEINKERLENAPGFDKDHWPNMSTKTWQHSVAEYYNVKTSKDAK